MKILRTSLIIAISCLFVSPNFAQGLFIKANAGYAFGMNGQVGFVDDTESTFLNDARNSNFNFSETTETKGLSLGKGMVFGVTVGYMFNKYIGVDLGFNYLLGGRTTGTYKRTETLITDLFTTINTSESSTTFYSNMFRLIPGMVVTPGFEGLNPYMKFGVVLGFGSMFIESENSFSSNNPSGPSPRISKDASTFNGGMAIGFNSALGVDYNLTDMIGVFGEVQYMGLSYSPKKSKITVSETNGIDYLPTMTVNEKETEYYKSLTIDENSNQNDDDPSKASSFSFPYSNLGLKLGIRFEF